MSCTDSTAPAVPPELAGILHQFDQLETDVHRAAAAAVLYQAMASVLALSAVAAVAPTAAPLPPLDDEQSAVLEILRDVGVMSAVDIAERIGCSVRSIKTWCGPGGVLRLYGVVPSANKGYGLETA